jgi:hypothetical protein
MPLSCNSPYPILDTTHTSTMADKKKQLVWNFIDFLKTSQQDGTVKEDDKESLDVASESKHEFS